MDREKCCPRLDKGEWDKKEFVWKEKPFYRTKYRSAFYIPLNLGGVVKKAMDEISGRDLIPEQVMMLSREESMFSSTLLVSIKEDAGADDLPTEKLSGKYLAMLFEGSYKETGNWVKEMENYLKEKGERVGELLFWYVTCPKCVKKYESAQTVIFAKIC